MPNKNKAIPRSKVCINTYSEVSKLISKRMGTASPGGVTILESVYKKDNLDDEEKIKKFDSSVDRIEAKIKKGEDLSQEDIDFLESTTEEFLKIRAEKQKQQKIDEYIEKSGSMEKIDESEIYTKFKEYFPDSNLRDELLVQFVATIVNSLERERELHPDFKVEELIVSRLKRLHIPYGNNITDNFSFMCRDLLESYYSTAKDLTDEEKKIYDTLLNKPNSWVCLMYMSRHLLYDSIKVKIGDVISFAKEYEDDETDDDTDADGNVHSAEEENPEHWQVKADTISSFNSLTKEARSILFNVKTGEKGLFGMPKIADVMQLHQKIMESREKFHCQTSQEFMDMLAEISPKYVLPIVKDNGEKDESVIGTFKNPNDETSNWENFWAYSLYKVLSSRPVERTVFFNCYRKNHLNYSYYTIKREGGKNVFYRESSGLSLNTIQKHYYASFSNIEDPERCLFNKAGYLSDIQRLRIFLDVLKHLEIEGEDVYNDWIVSTTLDPDVTSPDSDEGRAIIEDNRFIFIKYISDSFNLGMESEEIQKMAENEKNWKDFCTYVKGIAYDLNNRLSNKKITTQTNIEEIVKTNLPKGRKAWRGLFHKIVQKIDSFSVTSPAEKTLRYGKSTYYAFTTPNSLGDRLEMLGKHARLGNASLKKYLEDEFFICPIFASKIEGTDRYVIYNPWLRFMYEEACGTRDINSYDSFTNRFINSTTRGLGFDDKEFKNFSEKDNYLLDFNEWFNTKISSQTADFSGFGAVPLFVTGDSNSSRFLSVPILSVEECIKNMQDFAFREFHRMKLFKNFQEYCDKNGYDLKDKSSGGISTYGDESSADRFSYFDFYNNMSEEDKAKLDALYDKCVNAEDDIEKQKAIDSLQAILNSKVRKELEDGFEAFCKEALERQLLISSVNGYVINSKELYIPDLRSKNGTLAYESAAAATAEMIKEYYFNQKMHLMSQLQFLTVDPGFYAGTEDIQKRFKENIASGDLLDLTAVDPSDPSRLIDDGDGMQKVIYLTDIKKDMSKEDPMFWKLLESQLGDDKEKLDLYRRASLTDGQAYRSLSSYRKILIMRGGIWTNQMEQVYQIIRKSREQWKATHGGKLEGHRLSKEDFEKVVKLKVVFQPIKPFYYDFEKVKLGSGEYIYLPVQIKYSEFPLIPELLPQQLKLDADGKPLLDDKGNFILEDTKLASLGYVMEEEGTKVDLAAFTTCVKVGGYGNIDITERKTCSDFRNAFAGCDNNGNPIGDPKRDDEGNIIRDSSGKPVMEKLREQPKVHSLPLKGYRIQSNIPDSFNHPRGRGTQAMKHLLAALKDDPNDKSYPFLKRLFPSGSKFMVSKATSNSPEVSVEVKDGSVSTEGLCKMVSSLGSVGYLKSLIKLLGDFKDQVSISKTLKAIKAGDKRSPKDKLGYFKIESDGELAMSPIEGTEAADTIAALLAMFRKNVIKQRMAGGSAVQVSAYGFENVLKMNVETIKQGDNEEPVNVIHSDCAIPFDFSYTAVDAEGRETVVELDYFEYIDPNTGMPIDENGKPVEPGEGKSKLEKEFPGILDRIAYRIPTEKCYSMIYLRAKRFFPKTCGAIIMVPTQLTVIAGFDFDIDKLYFFLKEFVFRRKKDDTDKDTMTYAVWTDWYKETKNGRLLYPYLVYEAGLFYKVITPEEEAQFENGKPSMEQCQNILNKIRSIGSNKEEVEEGKEPKGSGIAMGTDDISLIDFYYQAVSRMRDNGEDIDYYAQKEDEFAMHLHIRKFRDKYFEPAYDWNPLEDVYGNSQTACNNFIFELFKARLCSKDTLKERLTPGGYYNYKSFKHVMLFLRYAGKELLNKIGRGHDASSSVIRPETAFKDLMALAKVHKGKVKPNYNPTEISTIAHYQTYNAEYDAMIGVAANISINLRPLSLTEEFRLKEQESKEGSVKYRQLLMGSMFNSRSNDLVGSDFRERMLNGQDTELNVTECLAAAVDAVKDALLEYFGISLNNLQVVCVLLQLGASPLDVGLMLNQPVVVKAMRKIKESRYRLGISDALSMALYELFPSPENKDKISEIGKTLTKKNREEFLTLDALAVCFNPEYRDSSQGFGNYLKTQMAVIDFLKELGNVADEMSSQVNSTKGTSTNSVQSTTDSLQAMEQRVRRFISNLGKAGSNFSVVVKKGVNDIGTSQIIDPDTRISKDNARRFLANNCGSSYCMEQAAYSCAMTFLDDVIGLLFPYRTEVYKQVSQQVANLTVKGFMDAPSFGAFNKGLTLYCLEHCCDLFADYDNNTVALVAPDGTSFDTGVHPRYFYNTTFPAFLDYVLIMNEEMYEGLSEDEKKNYQRYKDIPILQALHVELSDGKRRIYTLVMESIGGFVNSQKDVLIDSWADMFTSPDPILRELAVHLFFYSYYKNGFDFAKTSVMHLTPLILKKSLQADNGDSYRDFFLKIFNMDMSPDFSKIIYNGERSVYVKDFLKAFVMNNDLYQFKKPIFYSDLFSEDLIHKQAVQPKTVKQSDNGKEIVNEIKINFTSEAYRNPASKLSRFATAIYDEKRRIKGYMCVPCVVYNGELYVCDCAPNDTTMLQFNNVMGATSTITYYRMEKPVGRNDYSTPVLASESESEMYSRYGAENNQTIEGIVHDYLEKQLEAGLIKKSLLEDTSEEGPLQDGLDNNQHGGDPSLSFTSFDEALNTVTSIYESLQSEVPLQALNEIKEIVLLLQTAVKENDIDKVESLIGQFKNKEQELDDSYVDGTKKKLHKERLDGILAQIAVLSLPINEEESNNTEMDILKETVEDTIQNIKNGTASPMPNSTLLYLSAFNEAVNQGREEESLKYLESIYKNRTTDLSPEEKEIQRLLDTYKKSNMHTDTGLEKQKNKGKKAYVDACGNEVCD